ncbi:MAG: acyltransferase [Xanthomonadales bacterium]|nr:acyltransferase [Xanthomonadales bacterium]ODU91883.1 MAG: acyltransferase [Rhodanobacter sp. SCN 66-43]OJY84815.1 MAG: acyltransferase [Xanthomonadales bacterium 66-474]
MSGHWLDRPEAGGWFAIWLIRFIGLHFGRGFARLFLYPITLYFYFRRGPERLAARDYFRRIDGQPGNAWRVMRLIHAFASTILDRVFLLARGIDGFRVGLRGVDELHRHLDRGQGVLLLGAHVGSFEVLRVLAARRPECKLKLVMDKSKTPALTQLLEALAPELSGSVIDTARGGMDIVLALSEAAGEGAMITLLGDRGRPHELMRDARFIGADAPFPAAPWLIAALLKVPVVLCLGLYRGGNRYDLVFETLAEQVDLPRTGRNAALDAYIGRYAARLEHYLREAPCNWFNFYDFWQPHGATAVQPSVPSENLEHARVA